MGNRVKGMLIKLAISLNNGLRIRFRKWNDFRIACDNKQMLTATKTQILLISLSKIEIRTLRTSVTRIIGAGNNAEGTLIKVFKAIEKIPQRAFRKWKDYISDIKSKKLFDAARSEKLKNILGRLESRTLSSVIYKFHPDNLYRIKAAVTSITKGIMERQENGFKAWKDYIKRINSKDMLDQNKTLKLKAALSRVDSRPLRDALCRVLGGGDKIAGRIEVLCLGLKKMPKVALMKWKEFVLDVKNKKMLDNIRTLKLKSSMEKILLRTCRTFTECVLDNGSKTNAALRRLFINARKLVKLSFARWTHFLIATKNKTLMNNQRATGLKRRLEQLIHCSQKAVILRIASLNPKVLQKLLVLSESAKKVAKNAFTSWKNAIFEGEVVKLKRIIRGEKLVITMQRVTSTTGRQILKAVHGHMGLIKSSLKYLEYSIKKRTSNAFSNWKNVIEDLKRSELMDNVRTEKLRSKLESINKRKLRDASDRIIGAGNKLHGALTRVGIYADKYLRGILKDWKYEALARKQYHEKMMIRAQQFQIRLKNIGSRTSRYSVNRIINCGTKVEAVFKKLIYVHTEKIKLCFTRLQIYTISKSHKVRALGVRLMVLNKQIFKRTWMIFRKGLLGDTRILRLFNRLVKNYQDMQKECCNVLWGRVEKIRTIKKINSAYFVFRSLLGYAKKLLTSRFTFWKNLEYLRRRRIMKKSTAKMMAFSSVSYESAFWKWKYVLSSTGTQLNPKHSLIFKRIILIGTNYQKRLEQFSFYKLALYYKAASYGTRMSIPQTVAHLNKYSRDFSVDEPEKSINPMTDINKSIENPSVISTVASGKLTKEEVNSMNQVGALEMMFTQLKEVRIRNMSWGLCSMLTYGRQIGHYDSERSRLIDQINELRFEKHSLLEDNNTLRHHNESLIDNLEKTNLEFQTLSLHLDQMRLLRMVRVVSKMVEVPMAEAFSLLYENNLA